MDAGKDDHRLRLFCREVVNVLRAHFPRDKVFALLGGEDVNLDAQGGDLEARDYSEILKSLWQMVEIIQILQSPGGIFIFLKHGKRDHIDGNSIALNDLALFETLIKINT